jgi:hypothetical protein
VSLRRPGGSFGAPARLATGRIRSVSVAIGARGDVLVAWDARGVVRARFKPAGRRRFGPTETIRSEPTYFARLEAAVARGGRAYLAWSAQFLSEGGSIGPVFVQAAMRPSRARRFQAAELLDRLDPEHAANPVDLAADPGSGRAILGWTGFDGATNRARVAETDPSGRFSVRQDLSAPGVDAVLGDVDRSATGSRVAVWTASFFHGVERQVQGAYAPVGAAFGSPEEISGRSADTPRVAFERGTERPVAVWLGRTVGSSGASRTRLQAAARSG